MIVTSLNSPLSATVSVLLVFGGSNVSVAITFTLPRLSNPGITIETGAH